MISIESVLKSTLNKTVSTKENSLLWNTLYVVLIAVTLVSIERFSVNAETSSEYPEVCSRSKRTSDSCAMSSCVECGSHERRSDAKRGQRTAVLKAQGSDALRTALTRENKDPSCRIAVQKEGIVSEIMRTF